MPKNTNKMKDAIQSIIKGLMEEVFNYVLNTKPFSAESLRQNRPLYAALVPEEVFKASHFERSFVRLFGKAWEDLTVAAAEHGLGKGRKGAMISGKIKAGRLRRISTVLNKLEHPANGGVRPKPDWENELSYIMQGTGKDIPVKVVCDVLAQDANNGLTYAFEVKTPFPNSDITKVSKEKILKLHAMEPRMVAGAYFALPYNPYGKREDYAWGYPSRWFNMKADEVVLIGDELWEKIGGAGTYQAFIDAAKEIGAEYKNRVYRDFIGIEPPPDAG